MTAGAITVEVGTVRSTVAAALERHGARPDEARVQADHLVEGDLRGHPSHGIRRLATLAGRLDAGLINPASAPTAEWARTAALVVDGDGGFGPVVANQVIEMLLDRVAETGVATAALHNTHHLGMLSPYAEAIAARGAAGMLLTTTEGLVHPWGGRGALVGTNPVCIGVPSASGPVILDMSTAAVSAGAIIDRSERGIPLPEGWAVDADGHPTTDATAARSGAIAPFGGAKGYALGSALEALVGVLTGTSFGPDVGGTLDQTKPVTKGDLIVVFSVGAFGGSPTDPGLAGYLDLLRGSGTGGSPVAVPGDRARDHRARSLRDGVTLDTAVWHTALDLAGES